MAKRFHALAFTFVAVFLVLLAIHGVAAVNNIPQIRVPENACFKLELYVPETVVSGDDFLCTVAVKKTYGSFTENDISSMSGVFVYDDELFEITPCSIKSDNFTVNVYADGFDLTFHEPINCSLLSGISFDININARCVSNADSTIDRVYIVADNVSVYADGIFEGIGGIGYCEFVLAATDDTFVSVSDIGDESEYTIEAPEESEVASSEESAYEQIPEDDTEERYNDFVVENNLHESDGYLSGLIPGIISKQFTDNYNEITVLHYSAGSVKSDFISTNDVILFFNRDGTLYKRLVCVIKGDIDGDGKISSGDYVALRLYVLKKKELTSASVMSSDINSDGRITALDYVMLRRYLLKIIDIY